MDVPTPQNVKVNGATSASGRTCTVTWDAVNLSNVNYGIYTQGEGIIAGGITGTQYTFPENVCSTWSGQKQMQVYAHYTPTDENSVLSSSVYFTYRPSDPVGYYINGAWVLCVVHVYDGSAWHECAPFYYDNGAWKECVTT